MTDPLVSVIIPTYNRRPLLPRAVKSALEQEGVRVEVLICDDGSTDGTGDDWQHADARVRYLPLQHGGACAARNAGIEAAAGEYIAFLDSDDIWHADKLKCQLALLRKSGADAAACGFLRHQGGNTTAVPDARFPEGTIDRQLLLRENYVSTQTIVGCAECIKQLRFDPAFPRMQDWEFTLALTARFRMVFDRQPLVDVYVQADSLSENSPNALLALRLLYRKYQADYAASFVCTEAITDAIELYAVRLRQPCLTDCLRALSFRWTLRQNYTLLVRWLKAVLRGMRQH